MAEDPKPVNDKPAGDGSGENFPDVAAHNAEVVAKQAAQDISGQSMAPKDTLDASTALDALAKTAEDDAKKKADEVPAVESKTDEKSAAAPEKSAEDLAKEAAAAAERDAHKKKADELFKDSPGLPSNASPKSGEAFSALKIKAAQEIAKQEAELEKLRADKAELELRAKNQAPPEALKELEELRKWRAQLDVEADPKFKEFDKKVATTHEFIYAQLKKSPAITPEVIDAIKKHGGPENVQMDKIFEAIKDPSLQRLVETKLADIETVKFDKAQAVEAAKKNVEGYLADREKDSANSVTAHNAATEAEFNAITARLEWYKEKPIDPKATDEERKSAEAHNTLFKEVRTNLASALKDDSPQMRAIMLTGMAQLFYLQKAHEGLTAKLAVVEKAKNDAVAKYERLKQGSVSRLRESAEISGGKVEPVAKPSDQFNKPAGDALDELRKQVTEERARSASQAGGKA